MAYDIDSATLISTPILESVRPDIHVDIDASRNEITIDITLSHFLLRDIALLNACESAVKDLQFGPNNQKVSRKIVGIVLLELIPLKPRVDLIEVDQGTLACLVLNELAAGKHGGFVHFVSR